MQQAGTAQLFSGLLKCKIATDELDPKEHRERSHSSAPVYLDVGYLARRRLTPGACSKIKKPQAQLLFAQLALKHPFIYLNLTH